MELIDNIWNGDVGGGGEEGVGDEDNISQCVLKLPVNCDTFLDNCNSCVDTGAVHR